MWTCGWHVLSACFNGQKCGSRLYEIFSNCCYVYFFGVLNPFYSIAAIFFLIKKYFMAQKYLSKNLGADFITNLVSKQREKKKQHIFLLNMSIYVTIIFQRYFIVYGNHFKHLCDAPPLFGVKQFHSLN